MTLSRSIADRVAIVTGAGSGMGRATADLLTAEGARVAAVDLPGSTFPAGCLAIEADLADPSAIRSIVRTVRQRAGQVDIVVNCAGVSHMAGIESSEFDDVWTQTFAVNVEAQARLLRAVLGDLARNGEGRVVNIASTEGLAATSGLPAYTASKHAVIGLTRSLAVELGPSGVTVNCVCPGPINTGMTAAIPADAKELYAKRRVPMRRYGEPEEVAHMILSLVLPAASFVTGAVLTVDGGLSVKSN